MPASKTFTAIETPDYSIRLEYNKDYIILHLPRVDRMTKNVFLDMQYRLEDWNEFFQTIGYSGMFVAVDPLNIKIQKLLVKLGFTYKGSADNMNVYFYGEV